jgi:hypothetical protein
LVLPNVTITKVRLAWVWLPLPASHQVADLIMVSLLRVAAQGT